MFIIHITKTHLFSFMKSFLILIASFGLAFNTYAAEKSLSPEDMPQGFKSGDASAGSSLVESCVVTYLLILAVCARMQLVPRYDGKSQ